MLLCGSNRDAMTEIPYWLFQDSYGPNRGVDDYLKVRKGRRILTDFLEMKKNSVIHAMFYVALA